MERIELFFEEAVNIWSDGGYLMIPLVMLTLIIYFPMISTLIYIGAHNYYKTDSNQWEHWVEIPGDAKGEIGSIIRYTQYKVKSEKDIRERFREVEAGHLPRLKRRLKYASILVSAAPLTGLLGTVIGMLSTFEGLAISTGGDTIDLVAQGISEALITTQTGLIIAIPGYVLISMMGRRITQLEAFFTQLEILTIRVFSRRMAAQKQAA